MLNKSLIENKISNKNINNKKLKENNTRKSGKSKFFKKLKIYGVLILIISITSFVYFFRNKNYKNNWFSIENNKNKRQNISIFNNYTLNKMKHAILVLSSYGLDYLNNFLYQFNNDSRFDIYIHLAGKSQIDFEKGETILNSNIKYFNYIHNSIRFSVEMVDAMYDIMSIANSKYNYDFYHFFSESCYLVKSLDYIYGYFFNNKLNSHVYHFLQNNFLYNNQSNLLYKGSQWMSLNDEIVKKLLKRKDLFIKYKKEIKKGNIKIINESQIIIFNITFFKCSFTYIFNYNMLKNKFIRSTINNFNYSFFNFFFIFYK